MLKVITSIGIWIALVSWSSSQDAGNAHSANPTPQLPRMIRVSGGVMRGLLEHESPPDYPSQAVQSEIQGDVILIIRVDETGKIVQAIPVEGDPLLVAASVEALRNFHFRPYLLNGTPINVESQMGFQFKIKGKKDKAMGEVESMTTIPYRPEFRTGSVNSQGVLILSPRRISATEPRFPTELRGKSGSVYLTITIGEDGRVQDVKVIGGDAAFIAPVVDAVKQEVYEPQLVNGKPSVSTMDASYHFGPR